PVRQWRCATGHLSADPPRRVGHRRDQCNVRAGGRGSHRNHGSRWRAERPRASPPRGNEGGPLVTLALYGHPFSSYTWKALIALYANETAFAFRILDPDHAENATFVGEAHPAGKFPVL